MLASFNVVRTMLPRYHGLLRDGSMISGVLETMGDRQRQDAGREMGADRRDHLQRIDPLLTDASATQPGYEVGERLRRQAARASGPGDRLPSCAPCRTTLCRSR